MLSPDQKKELVMKLHQIGAIQFGEFTLISNVVSPIYVDMRLFVSYPRFLKQVAQIYADILTTLEYDRLAAIPYGALPIAAVVALELNQPWIFPRKEAKDHGTKKSIEGKYKKGETVVVIDDVITKGDSKIQALIPLEKEGLLVRDFVVLIDYEKGGSELLESKGYTLHTAITMREIADIAFNSGSIDEILYEKIRNFITS